LGGILKDHGWESKEISRLTLEQAKVSKYADDLTAQENAHKLAEMSGKERY
jgi:hypothetical protein